MLNKHVENVLRCISFFNVRLMHDRYLRFPLLKDRRVNYRCIFNWRSCLRKAPTKSATQYHIGLYVVDTNAFRACVLTHIV